MANEIRLKNLLVAQFFGAFNDNAWKLIVALLAMGVMRERYAGDSVALQAASQFQTTLAFCVLTLPLMLFSLPAGILADRISKRRIIVSLKLVEVVLMAAAMTTLALGARGSSIQLAILGLMGAQSALFSPAKYGILPELLPHERISSGNALLESWTFLAIILGTASAGALLDFSGNQSWVAGLFLTGFAAIGFLFSLRIPKVPAARSEGSLGETLRGAWGAIRGERILGLAVCGSVMFWTIASLLGQDILVYAKAVLGLSDTNSGIPLAVFALGVGGGSLTAGKLSRNQVEYGLIPLGGSLMTLASLLMGLLSPQFAALLAFMALMGFASGFLIVPLNSLVQWRAPAERRGSVIALSNVFVFSGIFAGSLSAMLLASAGLSPQGILIAGAVALGGGTLWAIWLLPDSLLRLMLALVTHSLYRLKVIGRSNLPLTGGVLLTPNHVSFVDALMLIAAMDRPVRFIVHSDYYRLWFFKPFMKSLGCIPISASEGPRVILRALRDAGEHLDAGEVVCIFPEGEITRTGAMLPFRRGLERIVRKRDAQIVPVYLDRLWGSIFSREGGRFLFKVPRRIPYPVTVAFGEPLDTDRPIAEIRSAVQELACSAWMQRKPGSRPLHAGFIRGARRNPLASAFADMEGKVSRIKALSGAVALARSLKIHWRRQERVGIALPTTIPALLVNLAATLSGRTAVNLNFTAGAAGIESAIRQAGLRSVVTSRAFVERLSLEFPAGIEVIHLEEIAPGVSAFRKLTSALAALSCPLWILERLCGATRRTDPDSVATVIFSSGSTGEPKGVLLSHFNIDSNVEAIGQVMRVESKDRVLGILPLFHSFGYMSFWFAASRGLAMPVHPNPVDAASIGRLVERYRVTILLATPTFLQVYRRRCAPGQFGSLRMVLTGAEKLSERLALAFEEKYGIRPLEGYGATECSPVIATSVPDFRAPGYYQSGSRRGFVGPPLPGVAVRVVDPDSGEPLPDDAPGMLLVKGPNVMRGYLGRPDLTEKAIQDGWYRTGDIALINPEGFIRITDRLSRFSKIGGEMVPHGRVEEALHQALDAKTQVFAVTALPDERKGEGLAVLHTCSAEKIPDVLAKLPAMGLPNLFIPRKNRFVQVDQLPLLGTGKLDLARIRKLAAQALGS